MRAKGYRLRGRLALVVVGFWLSSNPSTRALTQDCLPCTVTQDERASGVREHLEQAFSLALTIPDCRGTENLESCRQIEGLLADAFESLSRLFQSLETDAAAGCLSCDPRPQLAPMAGGLASLADLLEQKGYEEFETSHQNMRRLFKAWDGYHCCGGSNPQTARPRNREEDARSVIIDKCGESYVRLRQGLRQVFRVEGDRDGCFQSRACRGATSYKGIGVEAGYWTYDGEYWYIWSQRKTRGRWIPCDG